MSRTVSRQFGSSSAVSRSDVENWELIWENPNPTSSFAAQTISLNLAKYGWVRIEAMWSSTYSTRVQVVEAAVPQDSDTLTAFLQYTNLANPADAAGAVYSLSRLCEISQTGINFYGCSRRRLNTTSDSANSTQNGYLVPQRIWGKTTSSSAGGDASFHDSGFGFRKLWENPAPTEEFAGQTVSLDLSEYDAVYIDYGYTNGQIYGTHIVPKGYTANIRYPGNSSNNIQVNTRSATVSGTGVEFSAASTRTQGSAGTASTANTRLIPYHIYGIKFG